MKILLTGSIGVGKTTLFNALPHTDQVLKIPEVARRVLSEAPDLRLTPYFQKALLLEQYFLESEAIKTGKDLIICDRGYFDVIAYSRYFGIEPPRELIKAFTPYDLIFYCDPEGTPPLPEAIDGVTPNPHEKEEVDFWMRKTLVDLGFESTNLVGPTETRIRQFKATLARTCEGQIYLESLYHHNGKERK